MAIVPSHEHVGRGSSGSLRDLERTISRLACRPTPETTKVPHRAFQAADIATATEEIEQSLMSAERSEGMPQSAGICSSSQSASGCRS